MSLGKFSPEDNKPKGKEVLIHNLSHSDMILGIKTLLDQDTIVARPKFSQFNSVSLDLYNHIRSHSDSKIYTHPGLTSRENPVKDKDIPTGFEFPQDAIFHWTSDQLRFRDDDKAKLDGKLFTISYFLPFIPPIYFRIMSCSLYLFPSDFSFNP